MKTKLILLLLLVVLTLSGTVKAYDFMGPPTSQLHADQWGAGFIYSYSKFDAKKKIAGGQSKLKDLQFNKYQAQIGFGATEWWDAWVLLGLTKVKTGDTDVSGVIGQNFNGGNDFSWGVGTRFSFYEDEVLEWGALGQFNWFNSDESISGTKWKAKGYELQIAVGPEWDLDGWSIYGGPFLYYLDGEIKDGTNMDIEADQWYGAYIGANIDLTTDIDANVELLFSGNGYGFGANINWKF